MNDEMCTIQSKPEAAAARPGSVLMLGQRHQDYRLIKTVPPLQSPDFKASTTAYFSWIQPFEHHI